MIAPGPYNITAYQKTTLIESFELFSDVEQSVIFDLTGYTVKAVVVDGGSSYIPGGSLDLDPQITDPATLGQITITVSKADIVTAALALGDGEKPKWDLILTHTATGVVLPPVLQGYFEVEEVTTP